MGRESGVEWRPMFADTKPEPSGSIKITCLSDSRTQRSVSTHAILNPGAGSNVRTS